jgi:hypothetical protein
MSDRRPNQPSAPNPAFASPLDSGRHRRGVGEPDRLHAHGQKSLHRTLYCCTGRVRAGAPDISSQRLSCCRVRHHRTRARCHSTRVVDLEALYRPSPCRIRFRVSLCVLLLLGRCRRLFCCSRAAAAAEWRHERVQQMITPPNNLELRRPAIALRLQSTRAGSLDR